MFLEMLHYLACDDPSNPLKDKVEDGNLSSLYEVWGDPPIVQSDKSLYLNHTSLQFNRNYSSITNNMNFTFDMWHKRIENARTNVFLGFGNGTSYVIYMAGGGAPGMYSKNYIAIKYWNGDTFGFDHNWHRWTFSHNLNDSTYKYRIFLDGKLLGAFNSGTNLYFVINGDSPEYGTYRGVAYIKNLGIYGTPVTQEFDINERFDEGRYALYKNNYYMYG